MSDSPERLDFTLSMLRVASLRAKLFETEINSIGVALKGGLVDCYGALEWMKEIGALGLAKTLDGPEMVPDLIERSAQLNQDGREGL